MQKTEMIFYGCAEMRFTNLYIDELFEKNITIIKVKDQNSFSLFNQLEYEWHTIEDLTEII